MILPRSAGIPVAGTAVDDVDPERFNRWIVRGYEETSGDKVDLLRLQRMIGYRRDFYRLFCERAVAEGDMPPDMAAFCTWVCEWMKK